MYISVKSYKTQNYYTVNYLVEKTIESYAKRFHLITNLPMIVKPKNYGWNKHKKREILGGYLLNDIEKISTLIIKNPDQKEQSRITDTNIVYDVVNTLASTAFKINNKMLDFSLDYGIVFKLIEYLDSIENINKLKKSDYSNSEFKKLTKIRSKKMLEMRTLEIALIFRDLKEIYFTVRLDFRGRVYTVVDYLN